LAWQKFTPPILAKAKAKGIPNFHIFGEVFEDDMQPGKLARHTIRDGLPTVLDFAFAAGAVRTIGGNAPMDVWRDLIDQDVLYRNGADTARQLPTFLGNHDAGRFAKFVREANPKADDAEILARVKLGHVMMMTARGVPTVYYGDEQGFAGDGGDQDAREDMFPSKVAVYNDNKLVGNGATTAVSNFDTSQPIYKLISQMTKLRTENPALRRGGMRVRYAAEGPGLLAFTRSIDGRDDILVAINSSNFAQSANVEMDAASLSYTSLTGECATKASAPGSVSISLPAFGYAICKISKNN
jgi:neopullulanase